MRKTLIVIVFLALTTGAFAQPEPYRHAAGIRAGYSSGLTYKLFIDRNINIDVQALYNKFGFQLTAMYEYQFSPYGKQRLQYYAGIGPHGGNWDSEPALGAAVVVGLEFVFRKAPVVLGVEWKPAINLYKAFGYAIPDFGVTAKVVLK